MQRHALIDGYHNLVAAILAKAVDDLRGTDPRCGRFEMDRAWYFLQSDTCAAYCAELGADHEAVREKAAALYRKIIAKEGKPRRARYANSPGLVIG